MSEMWSLPKLFIAIIIFWIVLYSVQAQGLVQRCAPAEYWGGWVLGRAQPGRGESLQHLPSPHSSADETHVQQTPEKQPGVKGQRWEPLMLQVSETYGVRAPSVVHSHHSGVTFKRLSENLCIWHLNREKCSNSSSVLIHKGQNNDYCWRFYWRITSRAATTKRIFW